MEQEYEQYAQRLEAANRFPLSFPAWLERRKAEEFAERNKKLYRKGNYARQN